MKGSLTGKTRLLALAGALLIAAPSLALAENAMTLRSFDANGDGTLTAAEARAGFESQFASQDKNGDGALSEDEYVESRLAKLSELDGNGDGAIAKDEMRASLKERFNAMRR